MSTPSYTGELTIAIPLEIETALEPYKSEIPIIFPKDAIPIFDEDNSWTSIIDGLLGDIKIDHKWIRIFAIQTAYGGDVIPSSLPPRPAQPIPPALHRSARKSSVVPQNPSGANQSGVEQETPEVIQKKKPFIQTVAADSPSDDFPPLATTAPRTFRQITATISRTGDSRKIIIRKCQCGYDTDVVSQSSCECVSEEGVFLVPSRVVKSRQVRLDSAGSSQLINEFEFLVSWRPYADGRQYLDAWLSIDVLKQWRSAVLLEYLVTRIQFSPTAV